MLLASWQPTKEVEWTLPDLVEVEEEDRKVRFPEGTYSIPARKLNVCNLQKGFSAGKNGEQGGIRPWARKGSGSR